MDGRGGKKGKRWIWEGERVVEMWDWDLGNGCGLRRRAATLSSLYRNLTPTVDQNALVIAFAPVFATTYLNLHLNYERTNQKTDLRSESTALM